MSDTVVVTAPAKVNLHLHLTGRRSDGYHTIDSLFAFTERGDDITLSPSEKMTLGITGPFADALTDAGGDGPDNLVCRAAEALAAMVGRPPAVAITLSKNLPVAAGIGGGSSDAAAVLRGLMQLWQVKPGSLDLHSLALSLGADVPACLQSVPCRVSGIGEHVTPATIPWLAAPRPVLLVNPGVPLATPAVFADFKHNRDDFTVALPEEAYTTLDGFADTGVNSLSDAALRLVPILDDMLNLLKTLPGVRLSRLSGSGPTGFALFDTEAARDNAAMMIRHAWPHWWVWADQLRPVAAKASGCEPGLSA